MILHNRSSSKISDLSSTDHSAPSTVLPSPTSTTSSHHLVDPLFFKNPVLSHEMASSSEASASFTGGGAAKKPNPLIQALIEANVNYISYNELEIIGDLGSVSL